MTHRQKMVYEDFAPYFKVEDANLVRLFDSNRSKAGSVVGYKNSDGYLIFGHKNKYYYVHRAIFLLTHGFCPDFVDHINGDVADNRIENLRAAVARTNNYNRRITSQNTTGCKGVHRLKNGEGFQAYINYNGFRKFLGTFGDFEDAKEFVSLARDMTHGEFANHGVAQ